MNEQKNQGKKENRIPIAFFKVVKVKSCRLRVKCSNQKKREKSIFQIKWNSWNSNLFTLYSAVLLMMFFLFLKYSLRSFVWCTLKWRSLLSCHYLSISIKFEFYENETGCPVVFSSLHSHFSLSLLFFFLFGLCICKTIQCVHRTI